MKNRLYLSIGIVALLCLAGRTAHAQLQRSSSAKQTWEYKTILLSRNGLDENWSSWFEDDKPLPLPVNGAAKRKDLGDQGWELVAVVPYADTVGGGTTRVQQFYKRPNRTTVCNRTQPLKFAADDLRYPGRAMRKFIDSKRHSPKPRLQQA